MKSSDSLAAIAPALVKALAEFKGVAKDAKNPHFKNDYASLEAVIDTARPVLAKHGMAAMQGLGEYVSGAITVTTRIIHESGEWIESDFQIPAMKADPQAAGSAVTYGRRYSLMGMLGLPAVDDDGHAATHVQTREEFQAPPRKSSAQAKRDGDDEKIKTALANCTDLEQLGAWGARLKEHTAHLPLSWIDPINDQYLARRDELMESFRGGPDLGVSGVNGHLEAAH